jgi:hypothetical protein
MAKLDRPKPRKGTFDLDILEEVEHYRKSVDVNGMLAVTFMKPLYLLLSDDGADSYLKVRPVLEWRVKWWMEQFRASSFLMSASFCVKEVTSSNGNTQLWIFVSAHALPRTCTDSNMH